MSKSLTDINHWIYQLREEWVMGTIPPEIKDHVQAILEWSVRNRKKPIPTFGCAKKEIIDAP